ncbi:phospholipase D-like domain-containing protein [Flavobacteriales bacterium]|nr:phospholipase D-like domain-containing protein [Flavobacteriales bacterium]
MKLITDSKILRSEFDRLIRQYDNFYWTTAWAGIGFEQFNGLLSNQNKIRKLVVGIHFYQTHPEFIQSFINNDKVQFVNQPQGTFHPKLYLFHNTDSDWEVLVGSANFTNGAFNTNAEANVLIHANDSEADTFLKSTLKTVDKCWGESVPFSKTDLANYRIIWQNQQRKIKSLSGEYGSSKKVGKPIHDVPVINMKWKEFVKRIRSEDSHGLNERLAVVEEVQRLFHSKGHFSDLQIEERKFIAGARTKHALDSGFFGSMVGRGDFVHEIIVNNKALSIALDQIPLNGQITRAHYNNFVEYFSPVFPGNYVGVASRLLAMKRPDVFYCLTSKNQKLFSKEFNVSKSEINYAGYWDHIIERIYDSEWWLNPAPINKTENRISNARAAFLDAIYYEE